MTQTYNTETILRGHDRYGTFLEWCPRPAHECRAKWTHTHDVDPGHPTVYAEHRTDTEVRAAIAAGATVYLPNY